MNVTACCTNTIAASSGDRRNERPLHGGYAVSQRPPSASASRMQIRTGSERSQGNRRPAIFLLGRDRRRIAINLRWLPPPTIGCGLPKLDREGRLIGQGARLRTRPLPGRWRIVRMANWARLPSSVEMRHLTSRVRSDCEFAFGA